MPAQGGSSGRDPKSMLRVSHVNLPSRTRTSAIPWFAAYSRAPRWNPFCRKQHRLLSTRGAFLVGEDLHIFTLDRTAMILAFDEDQEVGVQRPEPNGEVYPELPIGRTDKLLRFDAKAG